MGKIISFDLDMTLIDHKQGFIIPQSAADTIHKLHKNNKIVIATGRDLSLDIGMDILNMIQPDAVIHMNGARVEMCGRNLFEKHLPKQKFNELIQVALSRKWCVGSNVNGIYYCTNPDVLRKREEDLLGRPIHNAQEHFELLHQDNIFTANAFENQYDIDRLALEFPEFYFAKYGAKYGCDIVAAGVSKAEGMKVLLKEWSADFTDVIAVGDSANDIDLLKIAGMGIAMGNATSDVKEVADYITTDISKEGIYHAFKYLNMI